jgi:hypothetical protein
MTWPDGIALAAGILAALLITHHQHQSATRYPHTRRTEQRHGPHHQHPQGDHAGEEDDPRPAGP